MVFNKIISLAHHTNGTVCLLNLYPAGVQINENICSIKQSMLVPLVTATIFPLHSTNITKLSPTMTRYEYMVASCAQIDHPAARVTPLPVILCRNAKKVKCRCILGTVIFMRQTLANGASLALTLWTYRYISFNGDWSNKCGTIRQMTVCSILRSILQLLCSILPNQLRRQENPIKSKRYRLPAATRRK